MKLLSKVDELADSASKKYFEKDGEIQNLLQPHIPCKVMDEKHDKKIFDSDEFNALNLGRLSLDLKPRSIDLFLNEQNELFLVCTCTKQDPNHTENIDTFLHITPFDYKNEKLEQSKQIEI